MSSDQTLESLFQQASKLGNRRYHKFTPFDFENYRKYDHWRYVNGDSQCGTTPESQQWVKDNSDFICPACGQGYGDRGGRTIDHKLPRAQYPWLSLDFRNLWVICYLCNQEKGERHWYEYEHYMYIHHPHRYDDICFARPRHLLKTLKAKR